MMKKRTRKIKINLSYEYLYEQYRILGKTSKEIAKEINCSTSTIADNLKKFNLQYTKKELWATEKYKNKQSEVRKKSWLRPSDKRKNHLKKFVQLKNKSRDFSQTPEYKLSQSLKTKQSWKNLITRQKRIAALTTDEQIIKRKEVAKKLWQDKNYVRKQILARNICPNKSETKLLKILNKYFPNEWKFVGDGQFKLAGKYPDFVHITDKTVIELYGEYWHTDLEAKQRIKLFKDHGYNCIIIWSTKNYPKLVKKKLLEFGYLSIK